MIISPHRQLTQPPADSSNARQPRYLACESTSYLCLLRILPLCLCSLAPSLWVHSPALSSSQMPCTVILGCGIHGLSAAYAIAQLQSDGRSITVVDVASDACEGASGRPTAFLSGAQIRNNNNLEKLLEYSIALHTKLAKDHQGTAKWQYESVQSYDARPVDNGGSPREEEKLPSTPEGFSWLACAPPWEESQWSGPTEFCSM